MRHEILAAIVLLAGACSQPDVNVGGDGFETLLDVPPEPIEAVDILFVIDTSQSMYLQQEALVEHAGEALFAQLAEEIGGLPDVHVAVTSPDVGAGDWGISGCVGDGDDGRFQIAADCPTAIDGTYLRDVDDGAGGRDRNFDGELIDAFACAALLGIEGCGFEQPLESMRRALDGSNPGNDGFLRDEAILLVVIIADEDDCSTFDNDLFATDQNTIDSPLGFLASFRCFEFGVVCDGDEPRVAGDKTGCVPRDDSAYMTQVSEYVAFLQGLKADPSMVMVAGVFGDAGPIRVIPDPNVAERLSLADVCPGGLGTTPSVRLHALAPGFPARWIFSPICGPGEKMGQALGNISRVLGNVMAAKTCLPPLAATNPPCRGFAAPVGGPRRPVPLTIVSDPEQCGGATSNPLAAQVPPGALEPGDHLIVECQVNP